MIKMDISVMYMDKKIGPVNSIMGCMVFMNTKCNIASAGFYLLLPTWPCYNFMLKNNGDSIWMRDYNRLIK